MLLLLTLLLRSFRLLHHDLQHFQHWQHSAVQATNALLARAAHNENALLGCVRIQIYLLC
jgi:hypothetical protein